MERTYGRGTPAGEPPMRYRMLGEMRWRTGEAVEIDGLELVFLSDTALELHAAVEVVLPARVRGIGRELPLELLCLGRVIRRVLANWPEVRPVLVVDITSCEIVPEAGDGDANAA